jgi:hypothetical protein
MELCFLWVLGIAIFMASAPSGNLSLVYVGRFIATSLTIWQLKSSSKHVPQFYNLWNDIILHNYDLIGLIWVNLGLVSSKFDSFGKPGCSCQTGHSFQNFLDAVLRLSTLSLICHGTRVENLAAVCRLALLWRTMIR